MVPVRFGRVWADDSGGYGPALVLLHPGVGDSRIWDPVMPLLANDFRLVRFDGRGYGRSPAPTAEFTMLDDLIMVIDHFGLEWASFVGCSQGGGIAVDLALARPDRVRALVLLAPGVSGYAWPTDHPMMLQFESLAAQRDGEALVQLGLETWAAADPHDPVAVEQMRSACRAWFSTDGYHQADPPAFDRLAEIQVPTRLLIGDRDFEPAIEHARVVAQSIPGCELVWLPGVDHMVPLRAPQAVADAARALAAT